MLNFKSNITYYLSSAPTDMRKGRESLAGVVREKMQRDPYTYGIDFGEYVEDILTRMMNGDDDYRSMIPCNYTPAKKQGKKIA